MTDDEKVRELLAAAFARVKANAREDCERELAQALGVPDLPLTTWQQLLAMVNGARALADVALGTVGDVDERRRAELLNAFGVADEWSRARLAAETSRAQELFPGPDDNDEHKET